MDISPGPPFWRIIPDDMDIPLLGHLVLSGRPDADIHGAAVNFALTAFYEVRLRGPERVACILVDLVAPNTKKCLIWVKRWAPAIPTMVSS